MKSKERAGGQFASWGWYAVKRDTLSSNLPGQLPTHRTALANGHHSLFEKLRHPECDTGNGTARAEPLWCSCMAWQAVCMPCGNAVVASRKRRDATPTVIAKNPHTDLVLICARTHRCVPRTRTVSVEGWCPSISPAHSIGFIRWRLQGCYVLILVNRRSSELVALRDEARVLCVA